MVSIGFLATVGTLTVAARDRQALLERFYAFSPCSARDPRVYGVDLVQNDASLVRGLASRLERQGIEVFETTSEPDVWQNAECWQLGDPSRAASRQARSNADGCREPNGCGFSSRARATARKRAQR